MRYLAALLPTILLLAACSSDPTSSSTTIQNIPTGGLFLEQEHAIHPLGGDFSSNQATDAFIDKMVTVHGFDRQQLHDVLSQTKRLDRVIGLMDKQAPLTTPASPGYVPKPNGAWIRYNNKFITPTNISKGVAFWDQYEAALKRAEKEYGVPPEIIVGIIGVETGWGRNMGETRIIDALATLSFSYPRRAEYFTGELEIFLLMARAEGNDPLSLRGSYAGAMGYGQFMPSSFKQYAIDFDGNGHTNLWEPVDAIGSVANYFKAHGWKKGAPVAVLASGQAPLLDNGFKTKYPVSVLISAGLKPLGLLGGHTEASLVRLDMGTSYQYWYGLPNFYTITRYNHSTHYAMAVWQLGQAVGKARLQAK